MCPSPHANPAEVSASVLTSQDLQELIELITDLQAVPSPLMGSLDNVRRGFIFMEECVCLNAHAADRRLYVYMCSESYQAVLAVTAVPMIPRLQDGIQSQA